MVEKITWLSPKAAAATRRKSSQGMARAAMSDRVLCSRGYGLQFTEWQIYWSGPWKYDSCVWTQNVSCFFLDLLSLQHRSAWITAIIGRKEHGFQISKIIKKCLYLQYKPTCSGKILCDTCSQKPSKIFDFKLIWKGFVPCSNHR